MIFVFDITTQDVISYFGYRMNGSDKLKKSSIVVHFCKSKFVVKVMVRVTLTTDQSYMAKLAMRSKL